jgi:predicted transcriptional regulator
MAGGQGRNTMNGRNGGRRITDSGDWVGRSDLSIMDDIESDDESHTIVTWIRSLQMRIRKMEGENNGLKEEIDKMKANAEQETSELIGRAQVQCERDERT